MPDFELRSIPGLPGYYAASDGTIWSGRWKNRPKLYPLAMRSNAKGYRQVSLWRPGGTRGAYMVHRLVALTFHGPRPDSMEICHLNHVKTDNRPENLSYGTQEQNRAQTIAADRQARGVRMRHKLTPEQVTEIRARLAAGEAQNTLAKLYGVARSSISAIHSRKKWRHLWPVPSQERVG